MLRMPVGRRSPRGFTLVELLVVIAIIGVLVSLLLPAVQAAREAARRMQCSNNLKQMALGLHNYVDVHKRLPAALWGNPFSSAEDDDGFGWMVSMLPFVEQSNIHDSINPQGTPGIMEHDAIRHIYYPGMARVPFGDTKIATYRCPSSALPDFVPVSWAIPGHNLVGGGTVPNSYPWQSGYATTDYKTNGGSCWGDFGVMHKMREGGGSRFADITDGLSNTILIVESSYVTSNMRQRNRGTMPATAFRDWPTWIGAMGSGSDEITRTNGRTNSPINAMTTPSRMYFAINDDNAFSYHPSGAQFALADGSVHFISQSIEMRTYCHLYDRRDGEVLGSWNQ